MALRQRTTNARYTWDDFVALGDEDRRELIDGELVETEVPTFTHEDIVAAFVTALRTWGYSHGGKAVGSAYKIRVSEHSGVMPDVQFYRAGNLPGADQEQGLVRGRPDLVVEVLSPSSRRFDRIIKLRWYAAMGVPEYWIVDPRDHSLERLVLLSDGHYLIQDGVEGWRTFTPTSFEGLAIPLSNLWGGEPDVEPQEDEGSSA